MQATARPLVLADAVFPRLQLQPWAARLALNVALIPDIPDRFSLTPVQKRTRDALKTGVPQIVPGLSDALRRVAYPLFFLDFESVAAACPLYEDVAPHASVPTQYSLHILTAPEAPPEHREFLHEDRSDPHRPVAERLLAHLSQAGTIVVYSPYEQQMIACLERRLPDLASALSALLPRLYDLCDAIRRHYYRPEFKGSFSIKQTLPALVPDLGYGDLVIADGGAATAAYREMIAPETSPDRRQEIARNLRDYCARDSFAMVRLYRALCQVA